MSRVPANREDATSIGRYVMSRRQEHCRRTNAASLLLLPDDTEGNLHEAARAVRLEDDPPEHTPHLSRGSASSASNRTPLAANRMPCS